MFGLIGFHHNTPQLSTLDFSNILNRRRLSFAKNCFLGIEQINRRSSNDNKGWERRYDRNKPDKDRYNARAPRRYCKNIKYDHPPFFNPHQTKRGNSFHETDHNGQSANRAYAICGSASCPPSLAEALIFLSNFRYGDPRSGTSFKQAVAMFLKRRL